MSAIKKPPVNSRDAQRGLKPTLTALKLHRNIKQFDPNQPNFRLENFEIFTFSTSRTASTASKSTCRNPPVKAFLKEKIRKLPLKHLEMARILLKLHRNIKRTDPGHPNFRSENFEIFTFSTSRTASTASKWTSETEILMYFLKSKYRKPTQKSLAKAPIALKI